MKMTKTAAAIALVGIAAAPMAQAEVTLTGYIGVILQGSDADGDAGELNFASDDSTINVAASHELNSGLTGYGNYRTDFGLSNGGGGDGDNIHVGIKGDFGDIRIGEVPDAIEFGQVAGDALTDIGGEERGISYTGSFGSATLGLVWSPVGTQNGAKAGGGSDRIGAGLKFGIGGFSVGVGAGNVGDDTRMSVGASFALGGASVGVAFKDFDNDNSAVGAKASWGAGDLSLALTFEQEDGDPNGSGSADDSVIRFDAGYDLGGDFNVSTRVNMLESDNGDLTSYRIMFAKSF